MGNSGSSSKVTARDRAILDLKLGRDQVQIQQRRLLASASKHTDIARSFLAAGDSRRARLALRRRKYVDSLLVNADDQLVQLEKLVADVEFAAIQKDVVFGIQQGTRALKAIQAEMGGIDGVERIVGENEDAMAYQEELDNILSSKMSRQDTMLVEDELASLEAELVREQLPSVPAGPVAIVDPADKPAVAADLPVPVHNDLTAGSNPSVSHQEPERQLVPA